MDRQDIQPPKWALRLLRWYCKPRALEIIEGDIYELFEKRLQSDSPSSARRMFGWDVLRFFRLRYIRGISDIKSLNNISMFKNYFKISFRSLYRQKFFSLINITGLSIGLAACLLIVLYISNELSYDKFHQDSGRIYRFSNGESGHATPPRLGIQSKLDFPEIEEITRVKGPSEGIFKVGDKNFRENRGFGADSTVHKIFELNFIEGNPDEALKAPNSMVLTASVARKYFNERAAFGEIIQFNGVATKVTGVVADPPKNTHFNYRYIHSFPHTSDVITGNWIEKWYATYAKLIPGSSVEQFESKMPEFVRKYAGDELMNWRNYSGFQTELIKNQDFT